LAECKLGCEEDDTIDHMFSCTQINLHSHITTERKDAIFANESEHEAVSVFMERHAIRKALLAAAAASQGLGEILDTSTPAAAGCAGARTGELS
jgi:hypothetical protein